MSVKELFQKDMARIWCLPVSIFLAISIMCVVVFDAARLRFEIIINHLDFAEEILTLVLFSSFLVTWYIVKYRYKKFRGLKIRRSIRNIGLFFVFIYVLYVCCVIYDATQL